MYRLVMPWLAFSGRAPVPVAITFLRRYELLSASESEQSTQAVELPLNAQNEGQ